MWILGQGSFKRRCAFARSDECDVWMSGSQYMRQAVLGGQTVRTPTHLLRPYDSTNLVGTRPWADLRLEPGPWDIPWD